MDVGCIDQRRGSTQAAVEIGRQASIFKQAKSTFVWLSHLDSIQLAQAVDDILDYGGNHYQNVYTSLEHAIEKTKSVYSQPHPEKTMNAIQRVKQLILQVGFHYLFSTNLNVQYGTARYRTTRRGEDHVYGIMQIYNLCVGKSARPEEDPSVEELVIEFAGAINYSSAILGQFFIHVTQPKPGYTWRITEESTVPYSLMMYRGPNNMATINADFNGNCIAAGKCCQLPILISAAKESGDIEPLYAEEGWGLGFEILLDSHINGAASFSAADEQHFLERRDSGTQIELKDVLVLWLGNVEAEFSYRSHSFLRRNAGLLLSVLGQNTEECVLRYERLGIVTWTTGEKSPFEGPAESIPWEWHDQLILK